MGAGIAIIFGAAVLIAGCSGSDSEEEPAKEGQASALAVGAIDNDRARDGLFAVEQRNGAVEPLDAQGFSGGDAQFPFVAWCLAPSTQAGRLWLANLDPEGRSRAIHPVHEVDRRRGQEPGLNRAAQAPRLRPGRNAMQLGRNDNGVRP